MTGENVVFSSMEARCTACAMYGGRLAPCIPDHEIEAYRTRFGRPCPRVILDADNHIPFDLIARDRGEGDAMYVQWLPLRLDALGLAPLDRLRLLERAMAARHHPVVLDYQERERERMTRPQRAER